MVTETLTGTNGNRSSFLCSSSETDVCPVPPESPRIMDVPHVMVGILAGARLASIVSDGLGFFFPWLGGDDDTEPPSDRGKLATRLAASAEFVRLKMRLFGDVERLWG